MNPTMSLTHSGPFRFEDADGKPGLCWLRVWQHPDRPTICVCSEHPLNHHSTISDATDLIANLAVDRLGLDADTILWIEHHGPETGVPEQYHRTLFQRDSRGRFRLPTWVSCYRPDLEWYLGADALDMPAGAMAGGGKAGRGLRQKSQES